MPEPRSFEAPPPTSRALPLDERAESLDERLKALHHQVRRQLPCVDRIACAMYDAESDLLCTFISSSMDGEPLRAYQSRLEDSPSLLQLVRQRRARVVDHIPGSAPAAPAHSRWVQAQGYQSSYTVPLFDRELFEGFLFYDSHQPAAFTPAVVEQLSVYTQLIALMVTHEVAALHALVGSLRVARDFAHLRDVETGTHLDRMSRYARLIAQRVAPAHGLGDEFVEQVFLFSPLHDIGKIGVADAVLLKPGDYTPEERAQMMAHVSKGEEMVARLVQDFRLQGLSGIERLRHIVACHHEYLDGSGYPRGLVAADIPLEARIVSVADVFDALTSERPYKRAWPLDQAWQTLEGMARHGQLDADCVAALRSAEPAVLDIMGRYTESARSPATAAGDRA